jgi:DNA-binding MurR/RpiR family transcriptional regulator
MTTATSLNELQQQIRDRYDSLSKRLQQVSRYVLDNTNSVAFDTVAVIAERADVPPSTLIRFANAFDFTGFNEMKQLFRMNLVEETASYSDRARLFREMESEAVPETPLDILQEFARSNARRYSSWPPAPNRKCWSARYSCWPTPTPSTSPDCAAPLASRPTSPMP